MSSNKNQIPKAESLELVLDSPDNDRLGSSDLSDFERSLFADGVYIFDPAAEHDLAENDIARLAAWYGRNPYWNEQRTSESIRGDIFEKRWDLAWKQHFSGQVPKDWRLWHGPMNDIEDASRGGIQLSGTLIDAAVSHTHHLVANIAGKLQSLNTHQLAVAFARDLPPWNIEEIVEAQRERGMSTEQIAEARKLSEEIRRRMSQGTTQLGTGTPEISKPETSRRGIKGILKGVVNRG